MTGPGYTPPALQPLNNLSDVPNKVTARTNLNAHGLNTADISGLSGVGFAVSPGRDTFVTVPVTFNPTGVAAATCKVEVSIDGGNTWWTLFTESLPAASPVGVVRGIGFPLWANQQLRMTVTNAALGTATWYS